jgi:putative transposase
MQTYTPYQLATLPFNIMRNMKKHTSLTLKAAIEQHPAESRREWMLWMMKRAGKKNSQNVGFQL